MYQPSAETGIGADVNIIEAMEMFKDLSDTQLAQAKRNPSYALFANLEENRRLRMRNKQTQPMPTKTVAEQLSEAVAMPQTMPAPPQQGGGGLAALMGQQMPQQMPPEMAQQMPVGMASGGMIGGPVAFSDGLMVAENALTEEDRREIERRIREGGGYVPAGPMLADPRSGIYQREAPPAESQPRGPMLADPRSGIYQRREEPPRVEVTGVGQKPQDTGLAALQQKLAQQGKPQESVSGVQALLNRIPAELKYTPPQIMKDTDYDAKVAAREKMLKEKFPDTVSPIAEQLAKLVGQQMSPEELQRRANREAALAMMGTTRRDFIGSLSEGLSAGDKARKALEETNQQKQVLGMQAQLANAKYKDALARQNFSDAEKYANELRELKFKQDQLNANAAVLNANILKDVAQAEAALRPRVAAGRQITPNQMMQIRKEAIDRSKKEIEALEAEYNKRTGWWSNLGSGKTPLPPDWKAVEKYRREFESERERIINRNVRELTGGMLGVDMDLSNPNALAAALQ